MDTQAMSPPSSGSVDIKVEYSPYPEVKRNVFTDRERFELKEIINETLDERERRNHRDDDDSWLYRGTY